MEAFIVARGHRITRGADMGVVDQKMFGAEMAVEHRRQQQITQPALCPVLLMQKFMRIDDADGARGHPNAKHQTDDFQPAQIAARHPPDRPIDQTRLQWKPN